MASRRWSPGCARAGRGADRGALAADRPDRRCARSQATDAGRCAALAAAGLATTWLSPTTPLPALLGVYLLFGVGLGTINPPITTSAVSGMPVSMASTGRQFGSRRARWSWRTTANPKAGLPLVRRKARTGGEPLERHHPRHRQGRAGPGAVKGAVLQLESLGIGTGLAMRQRRTQARSVSPS